MNIKDRHELLWRPYVGARIARPPLRETARVRLCMKARVRLCTRGRPRTCDLVRERTRNARPYKFDGR